MKRKSVEFRLSPGWKFEPSEREVFEDYLWPKNQGTLEWDDIIEANVYQFSPQQLVENYPTTRQQAWYFFTRRNRKFPRGDRLDRTAGDGYWKASGGEKKIEGTSGVKRSLNYFQGKSGVKTNWIMNEFLDKSGGKADDWVLCKIYQKRVRETQQANEIRVPATPLLSETSVGKGAKNIQNPSEEDVGDGKTENGNGNLIIRAELNVGDGENPNENLIIQADSNVGAEENQNGNLIIPADSNLRNGENQNENNNVNKVTDDDNECGALLKDFYGALETDKLADGMSQAMYDIMYMNVFSPTNPTLDQLSPCNMDYEAVSVENLLGWNAYPNRTGASDFFADQNQDIHGKTLLNLDPSDQSNHNAKQIDEKKEIGNASLIISANLTMEDGQNQNRRNLIQIADDGPNNKNHISNSIADLQPPRNTNYQAFGGYSVDSIPTATSDVGAYGNQEFDLGASNNE